MKKRRYAVILNACLFLLEVFAVVWMMSGISGGILSASRLSVLKFFTVDSNILMGIAALIAAVDEGRVLKGIKAEVSQGVYLFKLVGTVGVTLTMLVTVFFLAPTTAATYGFFASFYYSNFFLHLLNPVLSIIIFVLFEKTDKISRGQIFTALIPVAIYEIYYALAAILNSENGVISEGYDWYGFFIGGISSAFIVLPLILVISYCISYTLWRINRSGLLKKIPKG